jgi:hypothetical protein
MFALLDAQSKVGNTTQCSALINNFITKSDIDVATTFNYHELLYYDIGNPTNIFIDIVTKNNQKYEDLLNNMYLQKLPLIVQGIMADQKLLRMIVKMHIISLKEKNMLYPILTNDEIFITEIIKDDSTVYDITNIMIRDITQDIYSNNVYVEMFSDLDFNKYKMTRNSKDFKKFKHTLLTQKNNMKIYTENNRSNISYTALLNVLNMTDHELFELVRVIKSFMINISFTFTYNGINIVRTDDIKIKAPLIDFGVEYKKKETMIITYNTIPIEMQTVRTYVLGDLLRMLFYENDDVPWKAKKFEKRLKRYFAFYTLSAFDKTPANKAFIASLILVNDFIKQRLCDSDYSQPRILESNKKGIINMIRDMLKPQKPRDGLLILEQEISITFRDLKKINEMHALFIQPFLYAIVQGLHIENLEDTQILTYIKSICDEMSSMINIINSCNLQQI